jgi:hypothetical protein
MYAEYTHTHTHTHTYTHIHTHTHTHIHTHTHTYTHTHTHTLLTHHTHTHTHTHTYTHTHTHTHVCALTHVNCDNIFSFCYTVYTVFHPVSCLTANDVICYSTMKCNLVQIGVLVDDWKHVSADRRTM